MKKLILIIFALLCSNSLLKAQKTIVVCGQINNPVVNQTVWISFFSNPLGCTVRDTTATDSLGKYSYTFTIGAGCAYNSVRINMLGCISQYDTLWNTQFYDTLKTGPDTLKANFKYCDTCKVRANFNDSVNGKTISFYASTVRGNPNKFKWYFGDSANSTSTQQNPSFTYDSLNKGYLVCLVAIDTITGCKDSMCRVAFTASTTPPCQFYHAFFSDTVIGATATFLNSSAISSTHFNWDFGDGSSSNSFSPSHTYNSAGTYTVCLVARDTNKGCIDTICKQITISSFPCSGFNANFSFNTNCDSVYFVNTSSSSANKFSWTFGNSQTGTTPNSTQVYSTSGIYTACLMVEDTINRCYDSICKTIEIKNTLEGTVFRNNNQLADSGMVWLIEMTIDSLSGDTVLTAIDSVLFVQPNATYKFNNVTNGNYLLKAALLPGAAFYNNRLPTYYVKETRWDKATFINVSKCQTADIVLKAGNNPGGAGFIGGFVKQGANKVGDPLEQVLVLLYNADESVFGFSYTDINGEYKFENIAYGDYKVVVDVLGKPSEEYNTTINANRPKDNRGNFEVNTKDVKLIPFTPGSVYTVIKQKLQLYPNPTNNNATALFDASKVDEATITIMDLTGKTVSTQTITTVTGNNLAELSTSQLPNGLYIVTININAMVYVGRLGIMH